MKLLMTGNYQILKALEEPGKEGKTYYKISIFDPDSGEAGVISCTEDVIKKAAINKINYVVIEYNDKTNWLRAVNIIPGKEK